MDMISTANYARLCGVMAGRPEYSHSGRNQDFYTFPLEVQRLSGTLDRINIILRQEQLALIEAGDFEKLQVTGELRSYNNRKSEGARLVITVFAKELVPCCAQDENIIKLSGTLCKEPRLRCTPMGRDICDLMLAVNRHYGRSDYLPCICWGLNARLASLWTVGTELNLEGRIQSRNYIKLCDEGAVERTAFEVSVTRVEERSAAEV